MESIAYLVEQQSLIIYLNPIHHVRICFPSKYYGARTYWSVSVAVTIMVTMSVTLCSNKKMTLLISVLAMMFYFNQTQQNSQGFWVPS